VGEQGSEAVGQKDCGAMSQLGSGQQG
jgi:hypothetical protein